MCNESYGVTSSVSQGSHVGLAAQANLVPTQAAQTKETEKVSQKEQKCKVSPKQRELYTTGQIFRFADNYTKSKVLLSFVT